IIVGFPGETDDEWRQTLAFVDEMQFGHVHIFAYSPRAGTKAAGMPGQIDRRVKRARSRALHKISAGGRRETLQGFVGRTAAVLFERHLPGQGWSGYTPNFLRVGLDESESRDLENRVLQVRCIGISDDGERLLAELV
ncbi:MAG: tRNA (N(6)-L-threonylcarbamoyladenosine(37)-C(2))-methylthiotransferase MtaB, partial [Gammaproteobacteria bacterium]|nr:tRNA (N(6)-L-threonylcarbamoyladenosine(37)-C(2))-methylthiotransferase MtaB [Gammaproteobacteria bacterium]